MQNREMFLAEGGTGFDYVPCLNASAAHAAALTDVVLAHAGGWPEFSAQDDGAQRAAARQRALAMGAKG